MIFHIYFFNQLCTHQLIYQTNTYCNSSSETYRIAVMSQSNQNSQLHQKQSNFLEVPTSFNPYNISQPNPILSETRQLNRLTPSKQSNLDMVINSATRKQMDSNAHLFKSIKDMIYQLSADKTVAKERLLDDNMDKHIQQTRTIMGLNNQLSYLRQTLACQQQKNKKSEQNYEKTINQNQIRHRKQIKKYIDLVSDRQNQIQNLKKTIKSLTTRNLSLTSQLQSLSQVNQTLQNTIQKSLQHFKSNIKQFNYSIQQNELDKVVLEGKYKQLCDKIQHLIKQCQETDINKNKIQKKYLKLKDSYQVCRNQCVELRFQIERYKIRVRDGRDHGITKSANGDGGDIDGSFEGWVRQQMDNIKSTATKIADKFNSFNQIEKNMICLEQAKSKICELIKQNESLKIELYEKQVLNDELQVRIEGRKYEDELLAQRNPSLYQILIQKKSQIEKFQQKIQLLQKMALSAQQTIKSAIQNNLNKNSILTQERGTSCSQEQQKRVISKSKFDEIMHQFQIQKQKAVLKERQFSQKVRENDRVKIKEMEEQITYLKKENERLRNANESIEKQKRNYKQILQQMVQDAQPKKKNAKKTKNKLRCPACYNEISSTAKSLKCPQCFVKLHVQCLKNHECKDITDTESYQDN